MNVAVSCDSSGKISPLAQTWSFRVFSVKSGNISEFSPLPAGDGRVGATASILLNEGVDALICGEAEPSLRDLLYKTGITLYPGVSGDPALRVKELSRGELDFDVHAACPTPEKPDCSSCQVMGCSLRQ